MKNIIDKYINKAAKSKLYVCFVDFKSAFDTVWRKALLYKLMKNGICGNFINIIDSMYSNVLYRIKVDGFLSPPIKSNVGVKQGCVLSPLLFNLFLSDLPDIFTPECDPIKLHDTVLNCLMFADDLVIISQSATGLQKCLNNLQQYCSKWCLTINIDKTKIIIFNKFGYIVSRNTFYIYDQPLEIVKSYCYLGIIFSSNGSFKNACNALYDKALKAFYMLKQIQPHHNVKLALKLFDTLVFPILSYGGVVWGPLYAHKTNVTNFMNICNESPIEKLNTKMCKYILGVHRKSTNDAVRAELGRFPLLIAVLNNSYRYFDRMKKAPANSLVKISCMDEELLSRDSSWYNSMIKLINVFNQSRSFLSDMKNVYQITWSKNLNSTSGKLRTYKRFKKTFSLENYIVQFPLHLRRNLSKLRISSHNLAIETGRYGKKSNTSSDKRLCFNCKNAESEFHFLLECDLYVNERKDYFDSLNKFLTIPTYPSDDTFCMLMSCLNGDLEVGRLTCEFINSCFNVRSCVLNIAKEKEIFRRPKKLRT